MTILHAGEIGRLNSVTSILDSDDFLILRSGTLFRIDSTVLADYILNENSTTKEIVFADSPYTVLITDDYINVDSSGGNVVINFLPLATARRIYVRQNDGAPNTTTLTSDGSETIDGAATLVISSDGDAELSVPFALEWRTF